MVELSQKEKDYHLVLMEEKAGVRKRIKGYEGLYSINTLGDVYSHYYGVILRPDTTYNGYKQVGLYKNKKRMGHNIHRLVAETFLIKNSPKDVVNHKDGNRLNNSVCNLEWVTPSQNTKHAFKSGLSSMKKFKLMGRKNRKALFCIYIKVITERRKGNMVKDIGKILGVSDSLVKTLAASGYKQCV